jgi:NADPH:quinone reductase-like Zn-dependent oxidoreductase/SAM-dependent methyltransferase/NADP-dependent 3-hydroxy acid dehydrogenase YdfG
LYLPINVGRFRVLGDVPARCFVHARAELAGDDATRLNADLRVYSPQGALVLEATGLQFKSAGGAVLRQLSSRHLEPYLYAVDWQVLEGLGDRQAALDDWVADLPATLAQRADNREIAEYERFFEQFESLCTGYFARTLDELGWNALKQSALADELADALGVVRGHRRLFARMLTVLGEIGTLRKDGERWAAGRLDGPQRLDERLAELEQRYPSAGAEIALVRRCGPALARALRGECDPLELLFPGGAVDDAEGLYRDSPLAVLFNSCIADGIERMSRAGRRLRVLEVGAGTGGTTSHLLERVGDRIDYTFTDVSASFVNRARERFAGFGSVDFKELDLESDPLEQGMPEHGFDVVIASNVLHATRDLGATLNRVKRLLAPRGVLIAFEVLAPHHWFDLTVGMTPGWWAFEDADVRPDYPTISAPAWTALLERVGFVRPGVAVGADDGGVLSRQGIVVAQAPDAESLHEPGDWLILADRGGMGRALAAELEEAGHRCRVVDARELDMSRGDESASSVSALEELIGSRAAPWRGIVHLLALDNARWGSNVAAALEAELGLSCGSALDLAMACAGVEPARAPAVWVVTRGAQRVTGDEFHIEPAQATLWGLGKTVDLEHPALRWRRVDLDPSNPYDQTAELRSIILRGSDERQLAIRDGRLRVPRLRRWKPAKPRSIVEGDAPYELVIGERGSIDALAFRRAERRRPGEGEVEIAVAHTALNFKDVLNVLGLYPGDPGLLGSECAGVVTRVGGAVAGLQPGDRVVAVIGGSFSRFVCAPALQVAKIGDDLPLGRAVTAPIAYLTAEYALAHCGRLGAGDHVLIHAATGGVGMAAVQLARRAGAEIYATAGTAEKRDVLRSLGVRHVYDSRTLAFAEEILRDTGGRGVDVVLNSLADEFVDRSFEVIADGGRFLEIGKRGIWDSKRVSALPKRVEYHVIDWGEVQQREPALIASLFERVIGGLRSGELDPLPARVFPLERVQEAFRCMAQGKHIGKIVVTHPPSSESNDGDRVTAEATYLIAGGLTGLGLRAAQWLVDRGARHLALFGRSAPGVEAESVLAELAERGVEVLVGRADVADRTGLAGFLDDVRGAMPPIRGIVQSTGVLDDAVLLRQNWARFRKVFAPKIIGSQWLHELTAQDSLDFFILFSSLASITGSAGQANHAAANAYLDAFAAARRCDGRPAVSINWGPWSETGAAVRYGVIERGATRGLFPISPSEGLESLELIIGSGAEQVGVANIEWQAYLANQDPVLPFFEALHSKPRTESGTVADRDGEHAGWAEQLERMAPPRQRAEILKFVRAQVTRLLGLAGSDVETDRPLSEMGLDSLLAVEIRNVLGKGFDLTLPATVTFDHPSIDALAAYLFGRKFAEQGAEDPAERGAESASVIDDIETLSDDDIDRLIAERLRAND